MLICLNLQRNNKKWVSACQWNTLQTIWTNLPESPCFWGWPSWARLNGRFPKTGDWTISFPMKHEHTGWCWGHPFLENHLVDFWDICFLWMNLHVLSFFMNPAWKNQGPIVQSRWMLRPPPCPRKSSQSWHPKLSRSGDAWGFHGQFSFSWNIPEMSVVSLGISWTCYFHWDIPVFWEIPRILCLFMDFSARIICWFSSHGCSASRFSISAHSPILNGNAIIQQSSNYLYWRCSSPRIILQWWCCLMFQLKLIWLCFIFKFTILAKFELFEQQVGCNLWIYAALGCIWGTKNGTEVVPRRSWV